LEHPNQFYLESRKIRGGGGGGSVKQEPASGETGGAVENEFNLSEKELAELESMD
jgi:hypothetical protein